MRRLNVLFSVLFLSASALAQEQQPPKLPGIEEIIEWPEENIDIGFSALTLAKEFYPDLNIEFFLYSFAYMARRFRDYFGELESADERIRALNTYIYKPGPWNDGITFHYDDDDLQASKLSNRFINGYLATKKGSCITMPMLYVIFGERLGWPIYPVRSAKHFFVRYLNDGSVLNFQENIEATNGGGFISDKQYQKDADIPDKAIENGVYLRTLTKKEYLASLLLTNANEHFARGDFDKAKCYFQLSIKYDPTFSAAYWNYGWVHFEQARRLEEKLYAGKQAVKARYLAMQLNQGNVWRLTETLPRSRQRTNVFLNFCPKRQNLINSKYLMLLD